MCLLLCSCDQIRRPVNEPFVGVTPPPAKQEFRWSNGRLPKSFDPARAAAAPETDVVRALYEGLTSIDPSTSQPVPGLAEKWTSSDDHKTWTFNIRKDARWSNGKKITASDVAASWKRLAALGDKAGHRELYRNILGINEVTQPAAGSKPITARTQSDDDANAKSGDLTAPTPSPSPVQEPQSGSSKTANGTPKKPGLEVIGDRTLNISLSIGDKDFPRLVADPVFRPIYGDGSEFEKEGLSTRVVTSGPFRIGEIAADSILLERSETYWDAASVALERVRLVAKDTAESALEAYKSGELDAVTNADFEPLALKLLEPYKDFKQSTHGALNFYEVNTALFPFNDRRIREALAVSIDRERLVETELEGTAEPATRLLPGRNVPTGLVFDVERGRDLLERSGFPSGEGFPKIRLVIARNDLQQRVARSVARMWKQNLGVDTQIIVKEAAEMESVRLTGSFDLMRRGTLLPTDDVLMSLGAILGTDTRPAPQDQESLQHSDGRSGPSTTESVTPSNAPKPQVPWTHEDALYELNAIPLFFPLSYTLVKPYVEGFEIDGNGCPDLRRIKIDSDWTPKQARPSS